MTELWFLHDDGELGAKYSADVKAHDQPGDKRVVVTIEPTNVYPVDMSGG